MFKKIPLELKSALLIVLCIALVSAYGAINGAFTQSNDKPRSEEEKLSLKQSIALKAVEEYERWHKNGTMQETDSGAISILMQYWTLGAIPLPTTKQLQSSSWQFQHPWSAVFISWVMQEAGAGNSFYYANAHSKYIVWARENAKNYESTLFAAYDIQNEKSAWPEPGDLICMNRRNKQFNLQTINASCISHCDIVVEVNKAQGFITAIGGNICQTVSKRIVWLDDDGFIDTSKNWKVLNEEENNPEGSQRQIFGIIKVRSN